MLIQSNTIERFTAAIVKYFILQCINVNLFEVEHHLMPHYSNMEYIGCISELLIVSKWNNW